MPERPPLNDAVVIGGGISGLATAYHLHRAGLEVHVLEKSNRIGGAIHSERIGDFLVDYGPNNTVETSPEIRRFVAALDLADQRVTAGPPARRRYVAKGGGLVPLPTNPLQFLISRLFSTRAKFRLLREPFIPPADPNIEESIAAFVERRLGRAFLDYAVNPFVAGVYAGDPKRLSVRSAVPKIYALEQQYGSLLRGAVFGSRARRKQREPDKTRATLFSFKNGMGQLTSALACHLQGHVETGVDVEALGQAQPGPAFSVTYRSAKGRRRLFGRAVVLATPAYVTGPYLRPFDPVLAAELEAIVYAPVAVVFLGFRRAPACRPLDGFGFLVPEVENRRILGTIWNSTLFPNRAPAGGVALTTFVGGMRQPESLALSDAELEELVRSELRQLMGVTDRPDLVEIKRWPRAIPQYEIGHARRLAAIERFEASHPGLFLCGNYRGGIAVADCILHAQALAARVQRYQAQPVRNRSLLNR